MSASLEDYSLDELKLIYRLLHAQLTTHLELMDSALLHDLQALLQMHAKAAGVDLADHGQWDAWLGNAAASCAERVAERRTLR